MLNEIILKLKALAQSSGRETSLLYVSDHGESLGEKGAYLHGLPFAFAPKEQTHVPMLFWNNAMLDNYNLTCLHNQASKAASHDNLFDTLLGITNVASTAYQDENDLISLCKTRNYLAMYQATESGTDSDSPSMELE